jgi:hypothetical protein
VAHPQHIRVPHSWRGFIATWAGSANRPPRPSTTHHNSVILSEAARSLTASYAVEGPRSRLSHRHPRLLPTITPPHTIRPTNTNLLSQHLQMTKTFGSGGSETIKPNEPNGRRAAVWEMTAIDTKIPLLSSFRPAKLKEVVPSHTVECGLRCQRVC